jgi:hypothetical protein
MRKRVRYKPCKVEYKDRAGWIVQYRRYWFMPWTTVGNHVQTIHRNIVWHITVFDTKEQAIDYANNLSFDTPKPIYQ